MPDSLGVIAPRRWIECFVPSNTPELPYANRFGSPQYSDPDAEVMLYSPTKTGKPLWRSGICDPRLGQMASAKISMSSGVVLPGGAGLLPASFDNVVFDNGGYARLPDGLRAPAKGVYLVGVTFAASVDPDSDQQLSVELRTLGTNRNVLIEKWDALFPANTGRSPCTLVQLDEGETVSMRVETVGDPGFDFGFDCSTEGNGMFIALAWLLP